MWQKVQHCIRSATHRDTQRHIATHGNAHRNKEKRLQRRVETRKHTRTWEGAKGQYQGNLKLMSGVLGSCVGRSRPLLGAPGELLKGILGALGGHLWGFSGPVRVIGGHLGGFWGLEGSWEPRWWLWGTVLAAPGASWGLFLRAPGGQHTPLGVVLGPSWCHRWAICVHFGILAAVY